VVLTDVELLRSELFIGTVHEEDIFNQGATLFGSESFVYSAPMDLGVSQDCRILLGIELLLTQDFLDIAGELDASIGSMGPLRTEADAF